MEILSDNIEEYDFTVRTYNCLRRAGIMTYSELSARSETEIRRIRNLGAKSYAEIQRVLSERAISFPAAPETSAGYDSQGESLCSVPIVSDGYLLLEPHGNVSLLRDFYWQAFGYDALRYATFSHTIRSRYFEDEANGADQFYGIIAEILRSLGTSLTDLIYYRMGFDNRGKIWSPEDTARAMLIPTAEERNLEHSLIAALRSPNALASLMLFFDRHSREECVKKLERISTEDGAYSFSTEELRKVLEFKTRLEELPKAGEIKMRSERAALVLKKLIDSGF